MLLCSELESNIFAEGVSASMGGKAKGTATLNRRGGSASDGWQPLIWAAKDNNLAVAAAARLGLRTARDANMSRDGLRSIPATVVVNQRLLEEARAAAPSMQDREATLYQS